MTQEEKFKEAKRLYEAANADQRYVLESLFPELKESDDERIRKELISFFTERAKYTEDSTFNGLSSKEILAWLEKQCEQKLPIEKLPSEMKSIGESLGFTTQEECDKYNQMVTNLIMSDDKGEQKPAWSKEDEHFRLMTLGALVTCKTEFPTNNVDEQIRWIKSLKYRFIPQHQQKWSNEDEEIKNIVSGAVNLLCDHNICFENKSKSDCMSWLNLLKERVVPQSKQEWSEEDKKMVGNIRSIIEKYAFSQSAVDVNGELCEKEYIEADNWLKSLRPQKQQQEDEWTDEDKIIRRNIIDYISSSDIDKMAKDSWLSWLRSLLFKKPYKGCVNFINGRCEAGGVPQKQWKPSDKQMRVLDLAIRCGINRGTTEETTLVSLFNDLKKLK